MINTLYLNRYYKLLSFVDSTTEYRENHHIRPRCLGGSDDAENLVSLSARQHFIAHWLLWKAYNTPELTHAFWAMCHQKSPGQHKRYSRINSKTYAILKEQRSNIVKYTNSLRWKDPVWAANMKKILSAAASTPKEKARRSTKAISTNKIHGKSRSIAHEARWKDPVWAENVKQKMKDKWDNIEWADKAKQRLLILSMSKRVAIIIDGVQYDSIKIAASKFSISGPAVKYRLESKNFPNWQYKPLE